MQDLMRYLLLGGGGGFSPSALFAGGVAGAFYDPSDLSTLFEDSAGTTPVTGVEKVVGLMLDKSQNLLLGSETVTNGDFSNGTTGWTAFNATQAVVNGELEVTAAAASAQSFQIVASQPGKAYRISVSMRVGTAPSAGITTNASGSNVSLVSTSSASMVTLTGYVFAVATSFSIQARNNGTVGQTAYFDNISVRELPGNHATSTGSARPTLSARVNLLTKTEEFQDAAWTKTNATITADAAIAPNGTTTADKLIANTSAAAHLVSQNFGLAVISYTISLYAKAAEYSSLRINYVSSANAAGDFNLATGVSAVSGANGISTSITSVGDGWYRCVFTFTGQVAAADLNIVLTNPYQTVVFAGDGTSGIFLWGADLRVTNDGVNIPAYQRVNTATDYDTNGFPLYLSFGGAQSMSTPGNVDLSGTDKMTVYAGVRKLSDAARGIVAELTTGAGTGLFNISAPVAASASYSLRSIGTSPANADVNSGYAAPITNVMTGVADISGDIAQLSLNGVQAALSTADQGTGNYSNAPLYIGARNNASLFLTGRLYSLIVQGTTASATQLASTEAWVNQKTKAY